MTIWHYFSPEYKKYGIFLVIILFFAYTYSDVQRDQFVCNSSECFVRGKNLYGATVYKTNIDIKPIRKFEVSIDIETGFLNLLFRSRHHGTDYQIRAIRNDGKSFKFFRRDGSNRHSVESVANILNGILQDKENIDVNYVYNGWSIKESLVE